jgi:predicted outer membrane repeat protein
MRRMVVFAAAAATRNAQRGAVRAMAMGAVVCASLLWLGAATAPAAAPIKVKCPADDLQSAIDSARAGATIHVSGTCIGNFSIAKDLTVVGLGAGATLDGNSTGRVVFIPDGTSATTTITLENLTFTNGNINACSCGPYGPGIYNGGATLTVKGSTVTNNTGLINQGGGIYSDGILLVKNSTITANGPASSGAGIENDGTATVVNSTVSDNIGDGGWGSGITSFGSSLTVTGSTLSGNTGSKSGAAVYAGSGTVSISNSILTNNNAISYGGGILVDNSTAVSLTGTTVSYNSAGTDGGGIYVAPSSFGLPVGTVSLTNSTVTNNLPDNCAPSGAVAGCTG